MKAKQPNLVFTFADQMRAQTTGYAGDANAKTPNLDSLSKESINFTNAVSSCPVCSPARASIITGQYPLTHGVILNDAYLSDDAVSIAEAFKQNGYDTAYIGKWHLDGHGARSNFIPRERRQGFDFWRVLECTHDYNNSYYYGDENVKLKWDGYDAIAQTKCAIDYMRKRKNNSKPFLLFLSWGPPHTPYGTAPEEFQNIYNEERLILQPNVPRESENFASYLVGNKCCEDMLREVRRWLKGYFAHVSALDYCIGMLLKSLKDAELEDDTIFVFTSDHGDMVGSHGLGAKQKPWNESILVPFLLKYPALLGHASQKISMPFSTPDIMPTILDLCNIPIPNTVEGISYADYLKDKNKLKVDAALIATYHPFGPWHKGVGGKEWRGIRTERYTYVRDLNGPWLLYDNYNDTYQLNNLCNKIEYKELQNKLDDMLNQKLKEQNDEFLPSEAYLKKWGYVTDERGVMPYTS